MQLSPDNQFYLQDSRPAIVHTRCLWLILLILFLATVSTAPAYAQVLNWGLFEADLELGYDLDRQTTSQKNASDSDFDSDRFIQQLHLRGRRFFILDPRLATINFGAGIEFFQEDNNFAGQDGSEDGRLRDYAIDATIFAEKPYSLFLYANQTENRISRNFGTRTNIKTNTKGIRATLTEQSILKNIGLPFVSMSLDINQLKIEEDSRGNGQDFRRNEEHNVLQYIAHKGFQTADLGINYRYEDVKDNLFLDNSFTTQTANLNYNLDFGPTLNWRWSSLNNWTRRSGSSGNDILTANQDLRIHHNINMFSDYRYNFTHFKSGAGSTNTHSTTFTFSNRFHHNLTTSLNAQGSLTDLPNGTTKNYGGGPGLSYQRHISANGRLSLNISGNYQINDNNLTSDTIEAHNEPHQVGPDFPAGDSGFLLNNLLVITSSIVIIDRRDGSLLPLSSGIDFEVITEGDSTRIRPLPTSAILQANDLLDVSYAFQVEPSVRFSTTRLDLSGTLDYGWLALSAARTVSNQQFLSGTDNNLLRDRTIDTAEVRLHGQWKHMKLGANAGFVRQDSSDQNYITWHFGQTLTFVGFHTFTITGNLTQSFTNYHQPRPRSNENYTANIELNGILARVWRTRLYAGLLIFNDTEIDNQTTAMAGMNIRRDIGKLTISGNLQWNEFDRGFSNTMDRRINLRAIRRF